MNWGNSANIATTLGIVVTLLSIMLIYFGKIIRKSFGKKKDNLLEEGLSGFFFLVMYFIIPLLIIFITTNLLRYSTQLRYTVWGCLLIVVQFTILSIYAPKRKKCKKGYWRFTIIGAFLSFISLSITYYFILEKDLFFSTVSILFNFLILTLIAIKETKYLK